MKVSDVVADLNVVAATMLASPYTPIMDHFWFFDGMVTTFNDRLGMCKPMDVGFDGTIQSLVLDMLKVSYQAGDIEFIRDKTKDGDGFVRIRIAGGDQKNRFNSSSAEDARSVFEMPKVKWNSPAIAENLGKTREGIQTCLLALSTDQLQPERTGITIIPEDKWLSFYAFNNVALARCTLPIGETNFKGRVTVPADFWNIFLNLTKGMLVKDAKKSVMLSITTKEVQAKVGDVQLLAKTLPVEDPTDLRGIFDKFYTPAIKKNLAPITKDIWETFERNEVAARSDLEVFATLEVEKNELRVTSKGKLGTTDDIMPFDHPDVGPIKVRAEQLTKAKGLVERMAISEDVVALTIAERVYMVSARA